MLVEIILKLSHFSIQMSFTSRSSCFPFPYFIADVLSPSEKKNIVPDLWAAHPPIQNVLYSE